jgi:large-conductance mechanosensitive channel
MQDIFKLFNNELLGFLHFLLEKNVFQTGLAFVLATQVNTLFLGFVNLIVNPVIEKVVEKKTKNQTTLIFGIEFKTGEFLLAFLNFLIVLIFLYYLYKISDSSKGLFENMVNSINNIF